MAYAVKCTNALPMCRGSKFSQKQCNGIRGNTVPPCTFLPDFILFHPVTHLPTNFGLHCRLCGQANKSFPAGIAPNVFSFGGLCRANPPYVLGPTVHANIHGKKLMALKVNPGTMYVSKKNIIGTIILGIPWFFSMDIYADDNNEPLAVETLLSAKNKWRLSISTIYTNTENTDIERGSFTLVQTGPSQFIQIPTMIGLQRRNADTFTLAPGLRYGVTADLEVSGSFNASC